MSATTAGGTLHDEVVAWFGNPKPNGTGVMVTCPNHDDDRQSLHVSPGGNGRVLIHCHAGCRTDDVLARVGKTLADLYPPRESAPRPSGPASTAYPYVDEDGALLYQAVRRQYADRKEFFQRRPAPGGGWINDLKGVRRVPYRLPDLLAAPDAYVVVVEGEKDADRAIAAGFAATTNAGGAGKFGEAEARYLHGRDIILIADNDQAGYHHMLKVARLLEGKASAVRLVQLTAVPNKGDLSDLLDAGVGEGDLDSLFSGRCSEIPGAQLIGMDELASLAGETDKNPYANCSEGHGDKDAPPAFPLDVFPDTIGRYVADGAEAVNVPPDMIAVPLLVFAAGAIGNTRGIEVRSGWVERPNFWAAVIGEPGSGKSPALDYARRPLDALQRSAWDRHQLDLEAWEREVAAAKAAKGNAEPLPERPVLEHFFTTDATIEAVAGILATSPGVAVSRDELVGWVKAFDAYRKADDREKYLSLWAGSSLKVDRKGASTIYVPHPCVPIVGGIQPDVLPDLVVDPKRRDGFIDRILMVWPTPRPIVWNESTIDAGAAQDVAAVFRQLRLAESDAAVVRFDGAARQAFGRWYEENGRIVSESRGVAAGCYAKYPGQLARLALVLHALRYPADAHRPVDTRTLSDAITLIEYFRAHLVRILPAFAAVGSTRSAGLSTRVYRVLEKAGGDWVARRELSAGLGNRVAAGEIAAALNVLEGEGLVESRTVPTGARPRQESRVLAPNNRQLDNRAGGLVTTDPNGIETRDSTPPAETPPGRDGTIETGNSPATVGASPALWADHPLDGNLDKAACPDCGGPLAGNRYRCPACVDGSGSAP